MVFHKAFQQVFPMDVSTPRKKRPRRSDSADEDDKKRGRPRVEKLDASAADVSAVYSPSISYLLGNEVYMHIDSHPWAINPHREITPYLTIPVHDLYRMREASTPTSSRAKQPQLLVKAISLAAGSGMLDRVSHYSFNAYDAVHSTFADCLSASTNPNTHGSASI